MTVRELKDVGSGDEVPGAVQRGCCRYHRWRSKQSRHRWNAHHDRWEAARKKRYNDWVGAFLGGRLAARQVSNRTGLAYLYPKPWSRQSASHGLESMISKSLSLYLREHAVSVNLVAMFAAVVWLSTQLREGWRSRWRSQVGWSERRWAE